MPTNKNAQFRYRVIDRCLRNTGRRWSLNDLVEEISARMAEDLGNDKGISRRSVQYDISLMRSEPPRGFGAPIVCKDGYYRYEDPDYSIVDHPLIDSDVEQIEEALNILKQFRGLPHFRGLEQVLYKLEGQVMASSRPGVVHFEVNEEVSGLDWLGPLYQAINRGHVVKLEYQPFMADVPQKEKVHPYLLKEYNNRWFVLGYTESCRAIRNYALDRIRGMIETNQTTIDNRFIDPETYFCDIVGVTVQEGREKQQIVFRAVPEQAPYIRTKPIHHSQRIRKETEAYTEFSIEVIPNFELEQVFLSFGERVWVTGPESFRNTLKKRIAQAVENY